jgi:cobyrinic acid a,c-diamide synthase
MNAPRLVIAGLSGGGGKTLVSVGVLAAWRRSGHAVAAFKKGPDYIDAAWLSRAADTPCRNLDLFLMPEDAIRRSVAAGGARGAVAVIEGNRGLFDGVDARGTFSTAELAKLLGAPVVLVVDCTKATRTVAALVLGCRHLDPQVAIAGVILNRVAGRRHEAVLREAVREIADVPVLGALPRLERHPFPERHLGLVPPDEHAGLDAAVAEAGRIAEAHLDLAGLWQVAGRAPPLHAPAAPNGGRPAPPGSVTVGVFRDAAFQFYYPENLEALIHAGARLVEISPLADAALPAVDALYIGGGFPETLAAGLAANNSFRASVRDAVAAGLPVYAECGGAVYLGTDLTVAGRAYAMAGALPAAFAFGEKPQGHGYAQVETVAPNPFFAVGESVRGHEFHYTYLASRVGDDVRFAFRVHRGHGFDGERDGLCHRNVLASYTHVHALGTVSWAPALVAAAARHRASGAER